MYTSFNIYNTYTIRILQIERDLGFEILEPSYIFPKVKKAQTFSSNGEVIEAAEAWFAEKEKGLRIRIF